jgi:N-acetyl sugar amidotransferase
MKVEFCTRCVISNQRPIASQEFQRTIGSEPDKMKFHKGICGACLVAEAKTRTDWKEKDRELRDLLSRYRRTDGRYDVVVPGSGGKDSVYTAWLLKYVYDMHPLTVTWRPHEYTEVGWKNFNTWLSHGYDNILITPNPRVHRLLTKLAFVNLLHPFQPFILGQRTVGPRIAQQYGIDLVVYGEDDSEYEGERGWQASTHVVGDNAEYIAGCFVRELVGLSGCGSSDFNSYTRSNAGTHCIALGHYVRWRPQDAYYFAAERGFQSNQERTEGTYSRYNSIDDKLDPLHYYTMWIKWGVGRASHDASQEIRNGHLTRDEGVALVRQYDGELRESTVHWACGYMQITEDLFFETIDKFRPEWLWHKEGKTWLLQHRVSSS